MLSTLPQLRLSTLLSIIFVEKQSWSTRQMELLWRTFECHRNKPGKGEVSMTKDLIASINDLVRLCHQLLRHFSIFQCFFFNHLSKLKMCIPLPLHGELYFLDAYRGCSLLPGLGFRNTLFFWKLGIAIRTQCSYIFEHDCFPLHLMRTLRSFLWSWLSKHGLAFWEKKLRSLSKYLLRMLPMKTLTLCVEMRKVKIWGIVIPCICLLTLQFVEQQFFLWPHFLNGAKMLILSFLLVFTPYFEKVESPSIFEVGISRLKISRRPILCTLLLQAIFELFDGVVKSLCIDDVDTHGKTMLSQTPAFKKHMTKQLAIPWHIFICVRDNFCYLKIILLINSMLTCYFEIKSGCLVQPSLELVIFLPRAGLKGICFIIMCVSDVHIFWLLCRTNSKCLKPRGRRPNFKRHFCCSTGISWASVISFSSTNLSLQQENHYLRMGSFVLGKSLWLLAFWVFIETIFFSFRHIILIILAPVGKMIVLESSLSQNRSTSILSYLHLHRCPQWLSTTYW